MIIEDGAPMAHVLEVVTHAIRDPLHNYRLFNNEGAGGAGRAGAGGPVDGGAGGPGKGKRKGGK